MTGKVHRLQRSRPPIRATTSLGPTLEFMRTLWALDHALQRRSKRMISSLGVTGPQRLALRIIDRIPGASAGEVASVLKIHPSTLTGIMQRLRRRGLITRRRVAGDERRVCLDLTERGRTLIRAVEGSVEAAVSRVLRRIKRPQLTAAEGLLTALVLELEGEL